MSNTYNAWDRFYQKLNMIFNGIVASSMIPFAIVFLQIQKGSTTAMADQGSTGLLKIVLVVLSLFVLVMSHILGQKFLSTIHHETTIEAKLSSYLTQKIKHFALIEASAIVGLIGYFLTNAQIFAFVYVGILFVFSMHRPTFSRVSKEIKIPEQDLINWSKNE